MIFYKKIRWKQMLGLCGAFLLVLDVYSQENSGVTQMNLVDKVLNDFDNAEDWRANATSPLGDTKIQKKIQIGSIEDIYDPTNLTPEEKSVFVPDQNYVLGVKTYFKNMGFDRVEIKPPHNYVIKGLAKQVSVWVLGRNLNHTLYARFQDFRGKDHLVKMGTLSHFGWKKFTVSLPGWLPQSARFSLFDQNLKFVSLVVESGFHEGYGTYYFYVDQLAMKIDKTTGIYPGSQIRDLW